MADADDLMFGQISRRARPPAPRNVGGARIHHTMDVTHPARDQSRLGRRSDADRDVETFFDQIEAAVAQYEFYAKTGMSIEKA